MARVRDMVNVRITVRVLGYGFGLQIGLMLV